MYHIKPNDTGDPRVSSDPCSVYMPPVPEDSFPAQAMPSTARWTLAGRSFLVATRTSASLLFTLKYQPVQIVENPEE